MIFLQCNPNDHFTGSGHPENGQRISKIKAALGPSTTCTRIVANEILLLVHTKEYIDKVASECAQVASLQTAALSTGDVQISSGTYNAALCAVGTVLEAVDAIFTQNIPRIFCPVRPPGHHASCDTGMGFCVFNNVVVAARYAQNHFGINRVAILDWDVHHGNGTQDLIEEDPSILYFSTHQEGIYPETGMKHEIGVGNVFNYPIRSNQYSRLNVLRAFTNELPRIFDTFEPELIIISCGFDARENDPIGSFNLTDKDFAILTTIVVKEANKHCGGKILSVLEGGYSLRGIPKAAKAHVTALKE